jgi:DNA-binding NarL/FixJ family response regulator
MDIRMPELDGIEATRRILVRSHQSKPSVLILTTFERDEYVYGALRAGASGFVLKDVPAQKLAAAIPPSAKATRSSPPTSPAA